MRGRGGKSGQTFKGSFCQFSQQLPVDSRFTGRSGGWRRQAAAIRGFKTTYLAALFSLDTIDRGGGGGVLCHNGTYVCRLYLQIRHACDMKGSQAVTSLHHRQRQGQSLQCQCSSLVGACCNVCALGYCAL